MRPLTPCRQTVKSPRGVCGIPTPWEVNLRAPWDVRSPAAWVPMCVDCMLLRRRNRGMKNEARPLTRERRDQIVVEEILES